MGEMGGDDFARGTARGIEAAAEERAAKAELVAQELGKEVAELRAWVPYGGQVPWAPTAVRGRTAQPGGSPRGGITSTVRSEGSKTGKEEKANWRGA